MVTPINFRVNRKGKENNKKKYLRSVVRNVSKIPKVSLFLV